MNRAVQEADRYEHYRKIDDDYLSPGRFQYGHFVDVNVIQFGREQCKPDHFFGPAVRNHYLFHYILSGRGILESTDSKGITRAYELGSGEGFLISPHQVNTYRANSEDPWKYTWIEFDGTSIGRPLLSAGLSFDQPVWWPNQEASMRMERVMDAILENAFGSPYCLVGYAYLFLDCLMSSGKEALEKPINRVKEQYILQAVSYIEQHYMEDLSMAELADICRLNRGYFSKIFKEQMDTTPQQFLLRFRMSQACSLLKHSNVSVKEIGAAVGYPDQLHFSRAFKSVFSQSPREWRKQNAGAP